jgi:hypothetical protein
MSGLQFMTTNAKESSSSDGSLEIRRSLWGDRLIDFRESFLDLITGSDPHHVLNQITDSNSIIKDTGLEITADLKRYMDMAKIDAMDEGGRFVDYGLLKECPPYLEYRSACTPRLNYFDPATLSTPEEQLVFWINLYNALIMDGVITKEITQSVGSNPLHLLAFFRQTAYNVGGIRMSCDDIEHGILRGNRGHPMVPGPQFTSTDARLAWIVDPVDVRIHFALNCASRSCPPIQVYTADRLDEQLDLAARNFVNNDIQIDMGRNQINLSAIFKWFKADFGGREGVLDFLIEHLPEGERKTWLAERRKDVSFRFKTYDWGLNSTELGLAA